MSRYLSVSDLIRINERIVSKWGGLAGIRDHALLESAVARPQSGYYQDVIEEAAAYVKAFFRTIPFWTETNGRLLLPRLFSSLERLPATIY